MRIRLLPSAFESLSGHQFLTTFLINDTIAIDAGSLGFSATLAEQRRIRHVFLSHSHIDHVASLPLFLENVYTLDDACPKIHAGPATLTALRQDLFNDRTWPDFVGLSLVCSPFVVLQELLEGVTVDVESVSITPVSVDHPVPTFGFLVEEGDRAVVIVTDTGPTRAIWDRVASLDGLEAVFLDASFPDSMAGLASVSRHLTPALFAAEMAKVRPDVRFLAVHIKAAFRKQVVRELKALGDSRLEIAVPGKEYRF